jgi:hypothetical protein
MESAIGIPAAETLPEGQCHAGRARMSGSPVRSTIEVKVLDPLCDAEWDPLVISHPDCTFFHSSSWAKVLCSTYRHKPIYLHFSRRGELVALIPIMELRSPFTGCRGVSLPFSDFCSPLMFDGSEAGAVLQKLSELGRERNWNYFEVRGGKEIVPAPTSPSAQFYGHKMALPGNAEELLDRMASPVRRAIRKAQKSGLHVEVTKTRDAVLEFYRLHIRTRRRHGLPPQPLAFFLNIYREIIKAGRGFVAVARRGSESVAAAVFFQFGKSALYKFGASDELLQEFRGSNFVMWEAIRFLAGDGATMLHFGRTAVDNDGLRRFKLGWGTVEETIEYFQFDMGKEAWKTAGHNGSGFYSSIFRRLPLVVNRFAGAIIYPHLD